MATDALKEVANELAPTGRMRVAINFGNSVLAQRDPLDGQPRGVSADLARELSRRLGVPLDFVIYNGAGAVTDALKSGAWDVCFLAIDPVRSAGIDFTAPYVVIEGTYIVPADSKLTEIADVDRDGVRIAVGRGSAYDLFLTRTLKHAQLIREPTSAAALEAFLALRLEAAAGVRQPLMVFAGSHPDLRVYPGRFMQIEQAVGTPIGRPAAVRYLKSFVEEMKSSGFVALALKSSGQGEATVAPTE
ncbi:hypothetical protein AYO41_03745 [Verrucomicrobia bacterium SCGC AG-212-E04]|nr:hypothetical protein AYO41_03705 [Verrucomicrobia bacterium SCGC AG-212-E04]OAI42754.1 hypothetical protein AYO41_03745 [Verrucomicrobia bacterium SCGC AG-212-E04]